MRLGRGLVAAVAVLVVIPLAGCSGLVLANPPLPVPPIATAAPTPVAIADPVPILFPRDDGPHHRLTEWWYYTGHLATADGRHFGFEAVVFRAERGDVPVTWASHLALTDETDKHQYEALKYEIETLRLHPEIQGYVNTEFTDVD